MVDDTGDNRSGSRYVLNVDTEASRLSAGFACPIHGKVAENRYATSGETYYIRRLVGTLLRTWVKLLTDLQIWGCESRLAAGLRPNPLGEL